MKSYNISPIILTPFWMYLILAYCLVYIVCRACIFGLGPRNIIGLPQVYRKKKSWFQRLECSADVPTSAVIP